MYIPKHFEVSDKEKALSYIEANAFGELISMLDGRLFASHLPFLLSKDKSRLIGHFAKQNPQWQQIENQEVLVIFMDTHAYVSPQWYESAGVPTWNYQAVHVYGKCEIFHDAEKLASIVDELANKYETRQSTPWRPEYNENLLNGIVGVEISIDEIQCKFKLSQNRSDNDRASVIEHLINQGDVKLADAMKIIK